MQNGRTLVGVIVFGIASSFVGATPDTFGTTATSYLSIGPNEFLPTNLPTTYTVVYRLDASSGTWTVFPHLPSGALLTSIGWDYCDDDGGTSPTFGIFQLDRLGNEGPGNVLTPASYPPGCRTLTQDLSASNFVVDNTAHRFIMYMSPGEAVHLAGAVVGYKLQVSPPPATATFNDVPTSDFGFQYVEALVAAGVTGGCGGGNYCPDSPVTRRQMAIFIAKALGLQWP